MKFQALQNITKHYKIKNTKIKPSALYSAFFLALNQIYKLTVVFIPLSNNDFYLLILSYFRLWFLFHFWGSNHIEMGYFNFMHIYTLIRSSQYKINAGLYINRYIDRYIFYFICNRRFQSWMMHKICNVYKL